LVFFPAYTNLKAEREEKGREETVHFFVPSLEGEGKRGEEENGAERNPFWLDPDPAQRFDYTTVHGSTLCLTQ
jgi:hypothetical protein